MWENNLKKNIYTIESFCYTPETQHFISFYFNKKIYRKWGIKKKIKLGPLELFLSTVQWPLEKISPCDFLSHTPQNLSLPGAYTQTLSKALWDAYLMYTASLMGILRHGFQKRFRMCPLGGNPWCHIFSILNCLHRPGSPGLGAV